MNPLELTGSRYDVSSLNPNNMIGNHKQRKRVEIINEITHFENCVLFNLLKEDDAEVDAERGNFFS